MRVQNTVLVQYKSISLTFQSLITFNNRLYWHFCTFLAPSHVCLDTLLSALPEEFDFPSHSCDLDDDVNAIDQWETGNHSNFSVTLTWHEPVVFKLKILT